MWDLPVVAIECKTYLDKTMLQDAATAADQLKVRDPNAMHIVVAERETLFLVSLREHGPGEAWLLRCRRQRVGTCTSGKPYRELFEDRLQAVNLLS